MSIRLRPHLFIALSVLFLSSASADLPSRYELLIENYENDRAEGIKRLNDKYIRALKHELDAAIESKDLEEANGIAEKIGILEEEVRILESGAKVAGTAAMGEALLEGKTAFYQHDRFPNFTTTTVFHANGKATVTGVNLQPDPQVYEESSEPGLFYYWSESRKTKETGWTIRVDPGGKTASVENLDNGHKARAQIKVTE